MAHVKKLRFIIFCKVSIDCEPDTNTQPPTIRRASTTTTHDMHEIYVNLNNKIFILLQQIASYVQY